jgi:hypothetical protein
MTETIDDRKVANVDGSPLENLFDIEPGSTPTLQDYVQVQPNELIDPSTGEIITPRVDASEEELRREDRLDDLRIDGQLNEIHGAAMQAFYQQQTMSQQVDPKFSARNSEVAAQYLNIALSATSTKAKTRYDRQKIRIASKAGAAGGTGGAMGQTTNNLIVADRNSLLASLFSQDFEKTMKQQLDDETNPEKL